MNNIEFVVNVICYGMGFLVGCCSTLAIMSAFGFNSVCARNNCSLYDIEENFDSDINENED